MDGPYLTVQTEMSTPYRGRPCLAPQLLSAPSQNGRALPLHGGSWGEWLCLLLRSPRETQNRARPATHQGPNWGQLSAIREGMWPEGAGEGLWVHLLSSGPLRPPVRCPVPLSPEPLAWECPQRPQRPTLASAVTLVPRHLSSQHRCPLGDTANPGPSGGTPGLRCAHPRADPRDHRLGRPQPPVSLSFCSLAPQPPPGVFGHILTLVCSPNLPSPSCLLGTWLHQKPPELFLLWLTVKLSSKSEVPTFLPRGKLWN